MRSQLLVAPFIALLAMAGCPGNEATPFTTEGLEPLEPNTAPLPMPTTAERYPEVASIVSANSDPFFWAHLKGYVHASLATTWEAIHDPEVCLDRRSADDWSFQLNVYPQYQYSFLQHINFTQVITVWWDTSWRLGVREGTIDQPTLVGGRWQKTNGTTYVSLLEGSVQAQAVDANTTEIEFIEHLKSFNGPERAIQTIQDYYDSVVARVHGQPLPRFR